MNLAMERDTLKIICKPFRIGVKSDQPTYHQVFSIEMPRSASVEKLREVVYNQLGDDPNTTVSLIYCGRLMKDENSLSTYKIKSGSVINTLIRESVVAPETKDCPATRQDVVDALAKLMNPAYRNTVDVILTSTNVIDNIISASPELQRDTVAQVILKDLSIIGVLANPENVESVLKKHPCLADATLAVSKAVMQRVNQHGTTPGRSHTTSSYSLDRMSDDDEPYAPSTQQRATTASHITSSQLAEALAAAGAGNPPGTNQQQAVNSAAISRDALSQALLGTLGSSTVSSHVNTAPQLDRLPDTSQSYTAQLQQLRDMGITDETAALQALQAAGGNVHLAIDIIYGNPM